MTQIPKQTGGILDCMYEMYLYLFELPLFFLGRIATLC